MTRDEMQAQIDLLRQENDRLRRSVSVLVEDFVSVREEKATLREENDDLRAAIERVRALHRPVLIAPAGSGFSEDISCCDACHDDCDAWVPYPCPTIRALDGEGA